MDTTQPTHSSLIWGSRPWNTPSNTVWTQSSLWTPHSLPSPHSSGDQDPETPSNTVWTHSSTWTPHSNPFLTHLGIKTMKHTIKHCMNTQQYMDTTQQPIPHSSGDHGIENETHANTIKHCLNTQQPIDTTHPNYSSLIWGSLNKQANKQKQKTQGYHSTTTSINNAVSNQKWTELFLSFQSRNMRLKLINAIARSTKQQANLPNTPTILGKKSLYYCPP